MKKMNINFIDTIMISFISGLFYTLIAIIQPLVNIQESYPLSIIFYVFIRGFITAFLAIMIYDWYVQKS